MRCPIHDVEMSRRVVIYMEPRWQCPRCNEELEKRLTKEMQGETGKD